MHHAWKALALQPQQEERPLQRADETAFQRAATPIWTESPAVVRPNLKRRLLLSAPMVQQVMAQQMQETTDANASLAAAAPAV